MANTTAQDPLLSQKPRALIVTGGTGGHVFPALAVAQHLTGRYDVHVLVDERGKSYLKMDDPFTVHTMDTRPYGAGSLRKTIKGGVTLIADVIQATALIRRIQPRFVISFGSYVSVAPLIAARLLGIETMAHEQNAVMGRANRLACLVARRVALTFPETQGISPRLKKKTVVTGMPLRQAFLEPLAIKDEARPHGSVNILVMGGSLGARQLGRLVPEAVALMDPAHRRRLRIVQQCLDEDMIRVKDQYNALGVHSEVSRFFKDVPVQMTKADIIISRSGAGSLGEISYIGRASLLVPYPYATHGHQKKNAAYFEDHDAAVVLYEETLTPDTLKDHLIRLMDHPDIRTSMATKAKALHLADVTFSVVADR
jgi:UDP-N-acetylglucosamine--N-acetylmuramyl-(pentapeptide) pyrophosphoryl-undecaprenol N-acetylglucosamine transferase